MSSISTIVLNINANTQNAIQGLTGTTKAVGALGVAFTTLFAKISTDGIRAFEQFDERLRNIQSITFDTETGIQNIGEELKQMASQDTLNNINDLAEAYYNLRSAGFESTEVLRDITKVAAATKADLGTTTKAITKLMEAYKEQNLSSAEASQAFFLTIKDGVTTGQEYASVIGNVAKLASTSGVSLDELTTSMQLLTKSFGTAESVTQFKALLNGLLKPTKEAQEVLEKFNIEISLDKMNEQGFSAVLNEIIESTDGAKSELLKLFGSQEAVNAMFVLASENGEDFNQQLEKNITTTNTYNEALEIQQKSLTSVKTSLKNVASSTLEDFGKSTGQALIPFLETLTEILQAFNGLEKETRQSIIQVVQFGGAIGVASTAVIGLNLALTRFMGMGVIAYMQRAGMAMVNLSYAWATGQTTLLAMAGTLGTVTLAVGALAAGIYTVKKSFDLLNDTIKESKAVDEQVLTYQDYVKVMHNLEKKTNRTAKEQKQLAEAYRQVANGMVVGSEKKKELIKKSNDLLKVIKEEKETTEEAAKVDKETTEQKIENTEKVSKAEKLAQQKREKYLREYETSFKQMQNNIKKLTTTDHEYQLYLLDEQYKARIRAIDNNLDLSKKEREAQKQLAKQEYDLSVKELEENFKTDISGIMQAVDDEIDKKEANFSNFVTGFLQNMDITSKAFDTHSDNVIEDAEKETAAINQVSNAINTLSHELTRLVGLDQNVTSFLMTMDQDFMSLSETLDNFILGTTEGEGLISGINALQDFVKNGGDLTGAMNIMMTLMNKVAGVADQLGKSVDSVGDSVAKQVQQSGALADSILGMPVTEWLFGKTGYYDWLEEQEIKNIKNGKAREKHIKHLQNLFKDGFGLAKKHAEFEEKHQQKMDKAENESHQRKMENMQKEFDAKRDFYDKQIDNIESEGEALRSELDKILEKLGLGKDQKQRQTIAGMFSEAVATRQAGTSADVFRTPIAEMEKVVFKQRLDNMEDEFAMGQINAELLSEKKKKLALDEFIYFDKLSKGLHLNTLAREELKDKARAARERFFTEQQSLLDRESLKSRQGTINTRLQELGSQLMAQSDLAKKFDSPQFFARDRQVNALAESLAMQGLGLTHGSAMTQQLHNNLQQQKSFYKIEIGQIVANNPQEFANLLEQNMPLIEQSLGNSYANTL